MSQIGPFRDPFLYLLSLLCINRIRTFPVFDYFITELPNINNRIILILGVYLKVLKITRRLKEALRLFGL